VFVQIANLQMAKARQERIRAALSNQVDRCTREIARIDAKVDALYQQVGLRPVDNDAPDAESSASGRASSADDSEAEGFEYEY
jgi:uncharacterized coiled-coil protein SlyX